MATQERMVELVEFGMPEVQQPRVRGGAARVPVTSFNPLTRSWAAEAGPQTLQLPPLDGQLLTDAATLAQAADDYGHIVHQTPWAVLVPGSVEDIVNIGGTLSVGGIGGQAYRSTPSTRTGSMRRSSARPGCARSSSCPCCAPPCR